MRIVGKHEKGGLKGGMETIEILNLTGFGCGRI